MIDPTCVAARCKLDPQARHQYEMTTRRVYVLLTPGLEPELTSYFHGHIYPTHPDEMLPNWTLNQVRKSRKLILTLFYMLLLTWPASAFPNDRPSTKVDVYSSQKKIVVTSKCPPLTPDQLRQRMGPLYDESRMSADEPSVKRNSDALISNTDLETYFEDDDDIDELADNTKLEDELDSTRVQSRKFMRRKREIDRMSARDVNTNSESDREFLYMNMAFSTIERRKSRQRRGVGNAFHPAWECTLSQKWVDMDPGYFPTKILKGSCKQQKTCFFGLYACNPVKYSIKVLKRDTDDACKPVPAIGLNTTYEESWSFMSIHVTVACECSSRKSKRKRGRGGGKNRD